MAIQLTLSSGSLVAPGPDPVTLDITLKEANSSEEPRKRIEITPVTHVATGAVAGGGTLYEPKYTWNFSVNVTMLERRILDMLYYEHDRLRRALLPCDIRVRDTSRRVQERITATTARTRPIVEGTSAIYYPDVPNARFIEYYAIFQAWFTQEPQYTATRLDGTYRCTFTLLESAKLEA